MRCAVECELAWLVELCVDSQYMDAAYSIPYTEDELACWRRQEHNRVCLARQRRSRGRCIALGSVGSCCAWRRAVGRCSVKLSVCRGKRDV